MKITIEHEDQIATIEDKSVVGIFETLQLIKQALLGIGFHPDTVREYIDDE